LDQVVEKEMGQEKKGKKGRQDVPPIKRDDRQKEKQKTERKRFRLCFS